MGFKYLLKSGNVWSVLINLILAVVCVARGTGRVLFFCLFKPVTSPTRFAVFCLHFIYWLRLRFNLFEPTVRHPGAEVYQHSAIMKRGGAEVGRGGSSLEFSRGSLPITSGESCDCQTLEGPLPCLSPALPFGNLDARTCIFMHLGVL